ncbi:MAG: hypothetical protein JO107_11365, partial [Hyphomicrobiales bacterium]|nr:hypothetical protein [Hyphomicrobiales bacterium]MBV8663691.1 hypothetical protein [Hyphomicrobiales bacterium]
NPIGNRRPYSAQTIAQTRATFRLFISVCGDRPVDDYKRTDAAEVRQTLRSLPASFGKGAANDPRQAIKAADEADAEFERGPKTGATVDGREKVPRLTAKTIKRHFSTLTQLWRHLETLGHIEKNIFTALGCHAVIRHSQEEQARLEKLSTWNGLAWTDLWGVGQLRPTGLI